MEKEIIIRPIRLSDMKDTLEIYRPYVEKTNITFEYTVPTLENWKERILAVTRQFPWLIAECDKRIAGYAYATKHRDRVAYSWCCESSVYLSKEFQGEGIAKILYENLLEILKKQGYVNVYAILTSPNPASEKFHESYGFSDVGRFYKAGYKFGKWHDTRWMQLHLSDHEIPPKDLIPYPQLKSGFPEI